MQDEVILEDKTRIASALDSTGFPRWGRLFPQHDSPNRQLLLTTELKYRPETDLYYKRFFFIQKNAEEKHGVVCEQLHSKGI